MIFIVSRHFQQSIHYLDSAVLISFGMDGAYARHTVESQPGGLKGWHVELFTHFDRRWKVWCLLNWLLSGNCLSRTCVQPNPIQRTSQISHRPVHVMPLVQPEQANTKGHEVSAFITL